MVTKSDKIKNYKLVTNSNKTVTKWLHFRNYKIVTKWLQFGNKKLQNCNIIKHAQFAEGTIANWASMYTYAFFCIFMH